MTLPLALVLGLLAGTGCSSKPPLAPAGPPIVLQPPPAPAAVPDTAASKLVKRDTSALKAQVRQFVARPDVGAGDIDNLSPLTRTMNAALARMEQHHTRRGYRPADVTAARASADAVAHYLDGQARGGRSAAPILVDPAKGAADKPADAAQP